MQRQHQHTGQAPASRPVAGSNQVTGGSEDDGLSLSTDHPGQLEQQQHGAQATIHDMEVFITAV